MTTTGTRVLAQGTFDLLHPGHLHYLREAATHGDELHVVIGRHAGAESEKQPLLPAHQRRDVVAALDVVDDAHLGHPTDIYAPLEDIDPDVVAIGHDQPFDVAGLEASLADHGFDASVVRISALEDPTDERELHATSAIVERVLDERA
ncbi:adenylyltransferase/cytidyltransferase family protein [Halarchaeum sp. P4]|uniref:adenylyltransferase/cytidyltransferase family protein n=1 Tax=Halarchaeum sp. P4 TaxID=3421639 RepID=UPI003EC0B77E